MTLIKIRVVVQLYVSLFITVVIKANEEDKRKRQDLLNRLKNKLSGRESTKVLKLTSLTVCGSILYHDKIRFLLFVWSNLVRVYWNLLTHI